MLAIMLVVRPAASRNPVNPNGSGSVVYVQRSQGLYGRLQPVGQANYCPLLDGVFADNPAVLGPADVLGQYAAGPGNHAGGGRSTEDCPAVWAGQLGQGEYDERGTRHQYGGQYDALCGKGHSVRCL